MRSILVVVAMAGGLACFADPVTCVPDTLAHYLDNGSCAEGPFVIKNFAWNGANGTVPVDPSQVYIVPSPPSSGTFGLAFEGVPGQPNPFDISGDQTIKAELDYTIDPRPPILNGVTLTLDSTSPTPPGLASITASVCWGALLSDGCPGGTSRSLFVVDYGEGNPNNVLTATSKFKRVVTVIDLSLSLDMEANGATSEITGGSAVTTAVPEPASTALIFSALATFVAIRLSGNKARLS